MIKSPAARIIFSGNKATGIETVDGKTFNARHEVVLSLGVKSPQTQNIPARELTRVQALNTPQILMLSGIGPAQELKKHGIKVKLDMPEIGQNLQDHCFSTATLLRQSGTDDRATFEQNAEAAREQYKKDKSGLMRTLYCGVPMGL